MALFALRTRDSRKVREWFSDTQKRSEDKSLLRNPLKWKLKSIKKGQDLILVCDVVPVYFNFSIFGWITGFGVVVIWGYHWVLWPCILLGMLGYFWTWPFFYQMMKLALRMKARYTGPIKRVKLSELIKEVVL